MKKMANTLMPWFSHTFGISLEAVLGHKLEKHKHCTFDMN